MFDALLPKLETDLRTAFNDALTGLVVTARMQLDGALAEVARERAKGLGEVGREKADLNREIGAMHKHKEAQEGRVVLNIGGFRYETSVQTLRGLPHTFFDAYFSGRYAQDKCADGSIFIDRDGEHFWQILQYLRDGVVGAAEQEALELDVGVLRWLKREFGFYSIELFAEQQEIAFTAGGADSSIRSLNNVEHHNTTVGVWQEGASLGCARQNFSLCDHGGKLYAIGGVDVEHNYLASVERYDPSVDSWSASPSMPRARDGHCAVAVGGAIFVIGGVESLGNMQICVSTQAWSEVAPTPEPRTNAGACVVGSNIYYLGG
jgi:hypothetical protein